MIQRKVLILIGVLKAEAPLLFRIVDLRPLFRGASLNIQEALPLHCRLGDGQLIRGPKPNPLFDSSCPHKEHDSPHPPIITKVPQESPHYIDGIQE
jgi:hypothetical protein